MANALETLQQGAKADNEFCMAVIRGPASNHLSRIAESIVHRSAKDTLGDAAFDQASTLCEKHFDTDVIKQAIEVSICIDYIATLKSILVATDSALTSWSKIRFEEQWL